MAGSEGHIPKGMQVGVIGAGAWGTALAIVAARAGQPTLLWARRQEAVAAMLRTRENLRLPGVPLPDALTPTADLARLAHCDVLVLAVPAQQVRGVAQSLVPFVGRGTPLALAAKGVEQTSLTLMSDVVAEVLPAAAVAVL